MKKFFKNLPLLKFLVTSHRHKASKAVKHKLKQLKGCNTKPEPKFSIEAATLRLVSMGALFALSGVAGYVFSSHVEKERPPYVPYEYLRVRNKRYPWGDGDRSLFHNRDRNALPQGYEDDIERRTEEEESIEMDKDIARNIQHHCQRGHQLDIKNM